MAVKIRLARRGRKQRPFYHIVVADARAPRDGRFIENLGSYNPMTVPATIELDREKAFDWLEKGAQPTETVRSILRFKGVLYKKHLQRGVNKGAMSQEEADKLLAEWIEAKDSKIKTRKDKIAEEKLTHSKKLSGFAPKAKTEASLEEEQDAFREAKPTETAKEVEPVKAEEVVSEEVVSEEVVVEEAMPTETAAEVVTEDEVAEETTPEPAATEDNEETASEEE